MKKELKIKLVVVCAFLIIGIFITSIIVFIENKSEKDICKGAGVIFLRPEESNLSQGILSRNKNIIVIIPELNEIRGASELLNCPNLNVNFWDYLS